MKNKIEYNKTKIYILVVCLVTIFLFTIFNFFQYKKYQYNINMKIDSVISSVINKYPNISKNEILDILNAKEDNKNNLKEYGIDINKDIIIKENQKLFIQNVVINNCILLITFIAIFLIYNNYNKRKDNKLNEITKYIQEINKRNYKLNIDDNTEDELSILKNELYKITILLKEESENLKKDKKELKNAIEDISHQLKTPLTSIMILLDNIIEDENMEKEVREKFIKEIKNKTIKIKALIYSLLKLARFDTNSIEFKKDKIDLKKLVKKCIDNVDLLSELKNIEIKCNIEEKSIINCDKIWQEEAITNILKNAIEHSNNNSYIIINSSENKLYVKLDIINYGDVISEKDQKHIFERFYKCKNSSNESIGIGLNLTKTIIEKDNGIINVTSNKEKGTIFTIKYFK